MKVKRKRFSSNRNTFHEKKLTRDGPSDGEGFPLVENIRILMDRARITLSDGVSYRTKTQEFFAFFLAQC